MAIVLQRPLRGSRISSFYPVKTLPPVTSLDSAFQLQEYISLLIRKDVHDVYNIVSVPAVNKDGEKSVDSSGSEDGKHDEKDGSVERKNDLVVDEACWIYEQLRRLAQDLSHPLITMLQQECTRASCPEMKAGEWLYLCVAHGNDGAMEQCCAIDYILHTLDSATALLNSPRAFPSRLSIPQTSHRHFPSLARRLGRIFAHAYFHHREAFEQAEAESSLYARFLALTTKFDLVPSEFLVIPSRYNHDGPRLEMDAPLPRLLNAAINPQAERERERQRLQRVSYGIPQTWERGIDRPKSRSPPGLGIEMSPGVDSPRKLGRNRTDTMVFSEAFSVAEELAKIGDEEGHDGNAAPSGMSSLPDKPDEIQILGNHPVRLDSAPETSADGDTSARWIYGTEDEITTQDPSETLSTSTEFDIISLEPSSETISQYAVKDDAERSVDKLATTSVSAGGTGDFVSKLADAERGATTEATAIDENASLLEAAATPLPPDTSSANSNNEKGEVTSDDLKQGETVEAEAGETLKEKEAIGGEGNGDGSPSSETDAGKG